MLIGFDLGAWIRPTFINKRRKEIETVRFYFIQIILLILLFLGFLDHFPYRQTHEMNSVFYLYFFLMGENEVFWNMIYV